MELKHQSLLFKITEFKKLFQRFPTCKLLFQNTTDTEKLSSLRCQTRVFSTRKEASTYKRLAFFKFLFTSNGAVFKTLIKSVVKARYQNTTRATTKKVLGNIRIL